MRTRWTNVLRAIALAAPCVAAFASLLTPKVRVANLVGQVDTAIASDSNGTVRLFAYRIGDPADEWLLSLGGGRGHDPSSSLEGAGGITGLLGFRDANDDFFVHSDGGGNITAIANDDQAFVARYLYDPFGNVIGMSGYMAGINKYRFSGKEFDALTGLSIK